MENRERSGTQNLQRDSSKFGIRKENKVEGDIKLKKRKMDNLTIIFKFNAENILPRLDEFIEEKVVNIQKKYPHAHVRIEVLD